MNKENNKISKVILNLIQDLQRLLGSFSNGVRGRCQIKFGMTSYVKGFTLIEILVVVVIIAVLATVAVPQYQKAVLKSRFSSLMPLGKALRDGNESYYLEHGSYTNDPSNLDVKPNNSNAQITLGNEERHKYVLLTRDDINNNLRIYQQRSPNFPGETHCEALIDNAQANWLCRDALKGTLVGDKFGYTVYSLAEEPIGNLGRITYGGGQGIFHDGDICIPTGNYTVGQVAGNKTCLDATFYNSTCLADPAYWPSCAHSRFYDGSVCEGRGGRACGDNTSHYYNSTCNGYEGSASCGHYASFHQNSVCNGFAVEGGNKACGHLSKFTDATCNGYGLNSCSGTNTYTRSTCNGQSDTACSESTFKDNSVCNAYTLGACSNNTYQTGSYCSGSYCPEGAASSTAGKVWHREEGWGDETVSVLIDAPTTP